MSQDSIYRLFVININIVNKHLSASNCTPVRSDKSPRPSDLLDGTNVHAVCAQIFAVFSYS